MIPDFSLPKQRSTTSPGQIPLAQDQQPAVIPLLPSPFSYAVGKVCQHVAPQANELVHEHVSAVIRGSSWQGSPLCCATLLYGHRRLPTPSSIGDLSSRRVTPAESGLQGRSVLFNAYVALSSTCSSRPSSSVRDREGHRRRQAASSTNLTALYCQSDFARAANK